MKRNLPKRSFNVKVRRQEKLNSLYQKIISEFMERRLRMKQGIFTVTRTQISERGECLKVYFSVWPDAQEKNVLKFLRENMSELRSHLAGKIDAKFVPELEFLLDDSEKKRRKIETLLKKMK